MIIARLFKTLRPDSLFHFASSGRLVCALGIIALFSFVLKPADAQAQITITSATFTANANDCSTTTATVSGLQYCANYTYSGATVTVTGSTIAVDLYYTVGFICLPAIYSYTQSVSMGYLANGTYTVNVSTYLNNQLSNSSNGNSLSVANCCSAEASFTFTDDTICPGTQVGFLNTSTGASLVQWLVEGQPNGSSSNFSYNFGSPGTYEVELVAETDSCNDTASHFFYVSTPPIIELGNDTAICAGTSITFSVPSGYPQYFWSTGSSTNSATVSSTGLVSVVVTNEEGCQSSDFVNITSILANPTPSLGADTVKCPETAIQLNPGSYAQYQWSNGFTIPAINTVIGGTISVQVWDENGCTGSDTIVVDNHNISPLSLTSEDPACGSATLSTTTGYAAYQWNDLSADTFLVVLESDTYSVTVYDENGCTQSASIDVEVLPLPPVDLGNDTFICAGGPIILISNVTGSYLWNNGGVGFTQTVTSAGVYWLEVTDANGCTGRDTIYIDPCLAVEEIPASQRLFPNPASTSLFLERQSASPVTVFLYNMAGQCVLQSATQSATTLLDVHDLPSGTYLLEVIESTHTAVLRVVIAQP